MWLPTVVQSGHQQSSSICCLPRPAIVQMGLPSRQYFGRQLSASTNNTIAYGAPAVCNTAICLVNMATFALHQYPACTCEIICVTQQPPVMAPRRVFSSAPKLDEEARHRSEVASQQLMQNYNGPPNVGVRLMSKMGYGVAGACFITCLLRVGNLACLNCPVEPD